MVYPLDRDYARRPEPFAHVATVTFAVELRVFQSHAKAKRLSIEPRAKVVLEHIGLEPLLDLRMRLGESTGGLPVALSALRGS